MGQHGSLSTELRLRADDLKHLVRPQYVKGLTRSDVAYARPLFGTEPLVGQEILVVVRRFRHHINGSGSLLNGNWQSLTYDLAAIYGTIDPKIPFQFRGITSHLFDRFMDRPTEGGAGGANDASRHLFVLGPGELVRGIDVAWHDRQLVGMRVQTNQRQSQWFGSRQGVVKSVTAPQGYFINALETLRHNKNELGLRLCPVTDHLTRSTSLSLFAKEKLRCVGQPERKDDGIQTEFTAAHDHVRALVVACGGEATPGITDIHVLSSEQFGRHLAKREEQLPAKEHLFFLRHSEYLTVVEVHTDRLEKIAALRFRTNLTKSPWYGSRGETGSAGAKHTFQVPDATLQICGFHGTFGRTTLGSLGVFYSAIPKSVAGECDQIVKFDAQQTKTI
jgi:hypothetical protein